MRHTPRSTGLEHASTAGHLEWSGGRTDRDSGQRHQPCKYGPSPTGLHRMIPLIYKTTYGSELGSAPHFLDSVDPQIVWSAPGFQSRQVDERGLVAEG